MVEKRTLTFLIAALGVWAVTSTTISAYYYMQFNTYYSEYKHLAGYMDILSGTISELANVTGKLAQNTKDVSETVENLSKILESISLRVNILLKYNSNSLEWYNKTSMPLGSTAFDTLFAVAEDVTYKYYEGLGVLVTSINGVTNNKTMGWLWWYWNYTSSEWVLPDFASDKYILHRNDVIAWTYSNYVNWPPPPPT